MEDIFLKINKKKKIICSNIIEIDYREKNSLVPTFLKNLNHKIEMKELKIGDYLTNNIIIERKEIQDLVNSIKNKRIFKQIEEIKKYNKRLLIIEGDLYSQKSLNPNAIKGFILSVNLYHKIPVIKTNSAQETAKYISILANKKINKSKTIIEKKKLNLEKRKKYILQSFEGIGPKTSQKLIDKFKSLKNIFFANEEELKPILKKRLFKFIKQLN